MTNRNYRLRDRLRSHCCYLTLAVVLLAIVPNSHAANRRWSGLAGDGIFHTGGNWVTGVVPAGLDTPQFGLSTGTQLFYFVNFNSSVNNQAVHVEDDLVSFDLNGNQYRVVATTGIVIGNQPGKSAMLLFGSGTIDCPTNIDVGAAANATGELVVTSGGVLDGDPNINIGKLGAGSLTVQLGGDIVSSGTTTIGVGDGITGIATVHGAGSTFKTGTLNVGSPGDGTINVQAGGFLQNSGPARIGQGSQFTGRGTAIVNVMNAGSIWNSSGLVEIGDGGTGEVNITLGGKVTSGNAEIGSVSSGEVNVDGPGSLWESFGDINIGELGSGTLNITNQGVVESAGGSIGDARFGGAQGIGTVTVSSAGSQWILNTGQLTVGNAGTGTLHIAAGAEVQNGFGILGGETSGTGTVTVNGADSHWDNSGNLNVGEDGEGTLSITGGGSVRSAVGFVGVQSGSTGNVTVNGADSLWENPDGVFVGFRGDGILNITAGGHVSSASSGGDVSDFIGSHAGSSGLVTVDGPGSTWDVSADLTVGDSGYGELNITDGGLVRSRSVMTVNPRTEVGSAADGEGIVTVSGPGSMWITDRLEIGRSGQGTLQILDGGEVQTDLAFIGTLADGTGTVTVDGTNSLWTTGPFEFYVGHDGAGTLNITGGGRVNSGRAFIARDDDVSSVTVAGAESTWNIDVNLWIGGDPFDDGGIGTLRIQPGGTVSVTKVTQVFAGDLLSLEGGMLSTSEIEFLHGGSAAANFIWTSGILHVGTFDGNLTVPNGGIFEPENPTGFTDIAGNYTQQTGGTLHIEVGGSVSGAQHDEIFASSSAFLGGELLLSLSNGFIPASTDTFPILHAFFLVSGSFDNVANGERLATSDGLGSFVVNYGPTSPFGNLQVVLSAFSTGLPGDYNHDGTVDAADYVVWRKGVDVAPTEENYNLWRANFGRTDGSAAVLHSAEPLSAAVPEPTAAMLLGLSIAALFLIHRRPAGGQK